MPYKRYGEIQPLNIPGKVFWEGEIDLTNNERTELMKSKMEWEKWKELKGDAYPDYIARLIASAKDNRIPLYLLSVNGFEGNARALLDRVPREELVYYTSDGRWEQCDIRITRSTTLRLHPDWQPPEEPKELVGEDYLGSILHHDCVIAVDEKHFAVKRGYWVTLYCAGDPGCQTQRRIDDCSDILPAISASNSEIIWPRGA